MKHTMILLLIGATFFASDAMKSTEPTSLLAVPSFTREPEHAHQLLNAFRAGALTESMVDYFIKNAQQRHRARELLQMAEMAPEIFATAERLNGSTAPKAQIDNALAGLKLIDSFMEGEQDYVETFTKAERLAKALQIKIPSQKR